MYHHLRIIFDLVDRISETTKIYSDFLGKTFSFAFFLSF